jgi:hypothetical protein
LSGYAQVLGAQFMRVKGAVNEQFKRVNAG